MTYVEDVSCKILVGCSYEMFSSYSDTNNRRSIARYQFKFKLADFASKSTGMSGFFNFTDDLPLCCPYRRVWQQIEGLEFSSLLSLPQDFCISAAACPGILVDFCIPLWIYSFIGGGGGTDINWNHLLLFFLRKEVWRSELPAQAIEREFINMSR